MLHKEGHPLLRHGQGGHKDGDGELFEDAHFEFSKVLKRKRASYQPFDLPLPLCLQVNSLQWNPAEGPVRAAGLLLLQYFGFEFFKF